MSDTPRNHTTNAMGSLRSIAQTLDSLGMDSRAILQQVGISPGDLEIAQARAPLSAMSEVVSRAASTELGPLFGLRFAEHVHATTYHAFGLMLLSSPSLRSFCERLARYYHWVSQSKAVEFTSAGDEAVLSYSVTSDSVPTDRDWLVQASGWAATFLKLLRMAKSPDFSPLRVEFSAAEPAGFKDEYEHYFACEVRFASTGDRLVFAAAELDAPLPGGNAELARRSEMMVFREVQRLGDYDPTNSVRIALFDLLPRGRTQLEDVADYVDIDAETLRADLKDAGVNFQQVLMDTRRELAGEFILRADLSVNEIAYMLGFSDCSNFARSFRRWTGQSPSDFREQLHIG